MNCPTDQSHTISDSGPERQIALSEAKYRGLLEAAPDAMVVVDESGAIVLLNVQAEQQFGYRRDELIGRQVTDIVPTGFAERLIADGSRSSAEALAQHIGTGIELVALRKDGGEFPIEIMLSPLRSPDGVLVTAAIRDISTRKVAEESMRSAEQRYRGLLEAAPDPIVVVNQSGEIVLLNVQAEKQFGYSRDELLGRKVTDIIPVGFAERLVADKLRSREEALAQEIGAGIELTALRRDGGEFPIEIMLSPLESADGMLVTAAIRDVSVRKATEADLVGKIAELKRSNEELSQFAYIASHDLQEPLRMVSSYTQLLAQRYVGKLDSDADEFIAFAVDGATRMQRLIQDLLAYSRVGTKPMDVGTVSSQEALGVALTNLASAIEDSGAVVTSGPLPAVRADEIQLVQLFQNLIGNAIKYRSANAPEVHVSALQRRGKWQFSIKDNGLGIEAQYYDRIFGMFQRLHNRDQFSGTGIGLAICRKIVERNGGEISVTSTPGNGSTFHFFLGESELEEYRHGN
ncbi:MAG: sensor histidine kinase [Sphingomicrobium sp.]